LLPTEPPAKGDAWFLTLSTTTDGDRVVWRVAGRLGAAGAEVLRQTLMSSPVTGHLLVLDLEGMDYVSGAGVKAIEALAKTAHDGGGTLELVNVAEPVRICLDLAGSLAHVRHVSTPEAS
jgi:anti-sigma B factor antagonist